MRIHTRVAWLSFGVALIALGGTAVFWNHAFQEERRRELDARLLEQANLLAALAPAPGDPGFEQAHGVVDALHTATGSRFTLIRRDGMVVAESGMAPEQLRDLENHGERPEVEQALREGVGRASRRSATVAVPMAYVGVRWGPADAPYGVARASLPMTRVEREQNRGRGRILGAVLAALLFSGVVGFVVARRLSRHLSRLTSAAREIASGRLDRRVEVEGGSEIRDLSTAVNSLTDSVKARIEEAQSERERLARILENMPGAILVLDSGGRIALVNPSTERLFQVERGGFLDRTPVEATRNADLQRVVDRALRKGKTLKEEIKLLHPEPKVVEGIFVPLEWGLIVFLQDVTGLRRLQAARREMVANIGHELRTPLTAILGYLETLEHSPDLPLQERQRFLGIASRNARRLERLVQDLSRLAKLESPQGTIDRRPQDLEPLIRAAMETLAPRLGERGVRVETVVPEDLPPVTVDRHVIETVLLNLLDNALRVSPDGSTIRLSVEPREDGVVVSVNDQGPGVPREFRDRIFERFFRMDSGRASHEGGAGLGLAIVKHAVLLHRGDVWVEEGTEGGAVFRFVLPWGEEESG